MMVRFAKAGKRVVRLKSGDPMIFGRAGEEIARLESEGIAVAVVPGITAASAMAASLKTSLTNRHHAQQVRFVTGHSKDGDVREPSTGPRSPGRTRPPSSTWAGAWRSGSNSA